MRYIHHKFTFYVLTYRSVSDETEAECGGLTFLDHPVYIGRTIKDAPAPEWRHKWRHRETVRRPAAHQLRRLLARSLPPLPRRRRCRRRSSRQPDRRSWPSRRCLRRSPGRPSTAADDAVAGPPTRYPVTAARCPAVAGCTARARTYRLTVAHTPVLLSLSVSLLLVQLRNFAKSVIVSK